MSPRRPTYGTFMFLIALTALVVAGLGAAPAQAASSHPETLKTVATVEHSCVAAKPGQMTCFALRRTDSAAAPAFSAASKATRPKVTPSGLSPGNLQAAYALTAASATAGAGQTVAVVDAYNDPNAESDLAVYRSQYGLPACTTANGCFKKVNQNGALSPLPASNTGWAGEISLDIQMVSAICPKCKILLLEANSASSTALYTAENTAVALGAKFVSNSWGGSEYSFEVTDDAAFNHPGVAITVSAGDNGTGAEYPATSRYVTAVGGTRLTAAPGTTRGWTESAWSGSGSGCSRYETKPTWQSVTTNCTKRAESDVSAVADPASGVAVYQTYGARGWVIYGGTSVAAPVVAGAYALAGAPAAGSYPASLAYANATALNDVSTGSNGSCGPALCKAGVGWDGPTGLGTPNGLLAFGAKPATGGTGGTGTGTGTPTTGVTGPKKT